MKRHEIAEELERLHKQGVEVSEHLFRLIEARDQIQLVINVFGVQQDAIGERRMELLSWKTLGEDAKKDE